MDDTAHAPLALLLLTLLLAPAAGAGPAADLYARARAATVEIIVDDHLDASGFLIDAAGLVITADHVIAQRFDALEVRSPTIGRQPARVIARDAGHDAALLALPPRADDYPALTLADKPPRAGDDAWLLGAPLYRHGVLLRGMVARDEPTYEYLPDQGHYVRVYHVSGPSPPGTSGGPWLRADGAVLGLQSGLMHDGGAPVGIAYLVPADALAALRRTRVDAATPTLGIAFEELWEQPDDLRARYPKGLEALLIARVAPDGPAARAGLRRPDVITAIGSTPVHLRDEIIAAVRAARVGDTVELQALRPGAPPRRVPVRLQALEALSGSKNEPAPTK